MRARWYIAALALLSIPTGLIGQGSRPTAEIRRLSDSLARDFVARGESPSVAVAILRGNDTILIAAYGMADLENGVAATPQSVYRIGSVTKQFTAAAVMQLVEQGKVALDDSIAKHLPDLPAAWHAVTVRQLLNHTSGIRSYTALGAEWMKRWGEEMSPRTVIAMVATQPMDFPPGTKFAYNNTGYVLLGMLIEQVAGTKWGADLTTRFAKPLELTSLTNCMNGPILPKRVRGYEKFGTGWQNAAYLAMTQPYAAGAICATVGDIARWNRALHLGKVVSSASYALMTTPAGAAAAGSMKYGFGLARATFAGVETIQHGGGIHGFISANIWVPRDQLSITVLANSGSAKSGELQEKLVRVALGMTPTDAPAIVPLAAADRDRYVGVYLLQVPPTPRDFTVAVDADGKLTAELAGQPVAPLLHYGNHTFGVHFDPTVRVIFTIEGGKATKLTLRQQGQEMVGARKS